MVFNIDICHGEIEVAIDEGTIVLLCIEDIGLACDVLGMHTLRTYGMFRVPHLTRMLV